MDPRKTPPAAHVAAIMAAVSVVTITWAIVEKCELKSYGSRKISRKPISQSLQGLNKVEDGIGWEDGIFAYSIDYLYLEGV